MKRDRPDLRPDLIPGKRPSKPKEKNPPLTGEQSSLFPGFEKVAFDKHDPVEEAVLPLSLPDHVCYIYVLRSGAVHFPNLVEPLRPAYQARLKKEGATIYLFKKWMLSLDDIRTWLTNHPDLVSVVTL